MQVPARMRDRHFAGPDRVLGVPLAWFPRLLSATPDARRRVEISRIGLHWEDLDEDISIAGLLAGHSDMTRQAQRAV